ncbi:hypothetical protein HS088_TW15G00121 [Tripterygium wilfordii]|uniref:Uncharacterized protein n=1 Tax=Tripterygium wilfordii TaxID=458696 RepID=A0A7J7CKR4_TRIWF|nr:hypothetical protein HS088_TW15G00121 [Tripterygium wilfordii]
MSNINDQDQTHNINDQKQTDEGSNNGTSAPATPNINYVAPPPGYYSKGKDTRDIKSKGDGFWRGL